MLDRHLEAMKVMNATVEELCSELVWEGSHMVRFVCAACLWLPRGKAGIRELTWDLLVVCAVSVRRVVPYQ